MLAEQINHALFERGTVVCRAVAAFAMDDEPDFTAAVLSLIEGVIKQGECFGNIVAVQIEDAGEWQFAALHGEKAVVGDVVKIVLNDVAATLRYGARALCGLTTAQLRGVLCALARKVGMLRFMLERCGMADEVGKAGWVRVV